MRTTTILYRYACVCLSMAIASAQLPVKRVVLYKNGVGYFEHLGRVNGNQEVAIPFTSGQLNDALKSLTVLDLSGGRITGVEYASSAPVDRQLGDLRLPTGGKTTLTDLMAALRGARLEVRSLPGPAVTGRLLSVERKTRVAGGNTLEVDYIALLTDSGEIRTTEVSPSFTVRLLESGLPGKVNRMLDLVSLDREPDVRRMVVSTQGEGERNLFLSYISEVPVWKATYRVVLNSKGGKAPLLQGWAIVDNTVGQDWDKVELSLVAGAPQSFIHELSQPYYSRRPVVPLPEQAMVAPQTFEATLVHGGALVAGNVVDPTGAAVGGATVQAFNSEGRQVGSATTDAAGNYQLVSLPEGVLRLQVGSLGFSPQRIAGINASAANPIRQDVTLNIGSVNESIEVSASNMSLNTSSSSSARNSRALGSSRALGGNRSNSNSSGDASGSNSGAGMITGVRAAQQLAREQMQAAAGGQELGDLFEYKLKDPITIQKNKSALVPIVHAPVGAEKVSIWNESAGWKRPQRALWLDNTSGLTLDGGSFSVLEEETFAGEGIFEAIRPGEKRLVSYATDLAVNVAARGRTERSRVSRCIVNKGTMIHLSEIRESKTYTFRNEDASARTILLEHPVRSGYRLRGAALPAETASGVMRFRVAVPSKQTAEFTVEESRQLSSDFSISSITPDQVATFVEGRSITPEIEAGLRRVLARKDVVARLNATKEARDNEEEKIFDDQARLRENMKSLKGSAEEKLLLQRYTAQLNAQESRLEALRKEIEQLDKEIETAAAELEETIEAMAFDTPLA